MPYSEKQKKYLRGLGHALKPTLSIGNAGLTDAVLKEFDTTIAHHELIKVSVRVGERSLRNETIAALSEKTGADLIARIGNMALYYRKNPDAPKIVLPR